MNDIITLETVKQSIRSVPDFPKKGIMFKDITTALMNEQIFNFLVDNISEYYNDLGITKVVGIESRGFILGGAIAYKLNAGFILARKPGKLPYDKISESYELEYGKNTIELHKDALDSNDIVLVHDDLLATGGTANAAINLIQKFNVKKTYVNFLCDLSFLNGMNQINEKAEAYSLISF